MAEAEAGEAGEGGALAALANNLDILGNEKRLHLLEYLVEPHYIQEIASELGMARQSAQAHVDKLLEIGVIERRRGRRETGPVTDYVVVPHRLFQVQETFARLGHLEPEVEPDHERRAVTATLDPQDDGGEPAPVSRLVTVHGLRIGRVTPLQGGGPWLIGRDPAATLCLDYDPFVSTRHAEVRRRADGRFELADLYSRNGTQVDWRPLDRGQAVELVPGAVLGIGKTLLVFRRPD